MGNDINLAIVNNSDEDWQNVIVTANPGPNPFSSNIGTVRAHGDGGVVVTDLTSVSGYRYDPHNYKISTVGVNVDTPHGHVQAILPVTMAPPVPPITTIPSAPPMDSSADHTDWDNARRMESAPSPYQYDANGNVVP
ncbi:hypothetical protein CCAX7_26290 [Capsulimonas corticalis]|uniref:Uncharacterized protein n=1 Tax=Capsulimonas corticalis TaxID=2219043 RepID=A0A402D6K3_9BACT|nr:hypothetical protein CCAX7_26290 [Capsulimonas corticalis]